MAACWCNFGRYPLNWLNFDLFMTVFCPSAILKQRLDSVVLRSLAVGDNQGPALRPVPEPTNSWASHPLVVPSIGAQCKNENNMAPHWEYIGSVWCHSTSCQHVNPMFPNELQEKVFAVSTRNVLWNYRNAYNGMLSVLFGCDDWYSRVTCSAQRSHCEARPCL